MKHDITTCVGPSDHSTQRDKPVNAGSHVYTISQRREKSRELESFVDNFNLIGESHFPRYSWNLFARQ